jgi:hypothetical protein
MTIEEPPGGDGPLFSTRLLMVGVGLAVVVVIALIVVVVGPGSPPSSAPPASSAGHAASHATAAPGAASPAAGAGADDCDVPVPPGSQAIPDTTPDVTWQLYDTVALPYSAQAGPTQVQGDVARCYAHDPLGALLAACQIAIRYVLASNWQAVLADQVMAGTGRNVYAAQRPDMNVSVSPGEYGQYAGFQFVTYTSALAVIQIVVQLQGEYQTTTMTVQWYGGDWRLQLQPTGSPGPNVQEIPNLTGFIPFGGI